MGLLDGVLGNALNSVLGGAGGPANLQGMLGSLLSRLGGPEQSQVLLTTAINMVQQNGGLEGILAKFRAQGHGNAVDSWIGTGDNHVISAQHVEQVLGTSTVNEVATQMGMTPAQASGSLASVLPELINSLTPNGHVPADSNDLIAQAVALLKSKLGASHG